MNKVKTKAIILKRQNYKESDRLLTLFSRELGKITVIAKGARRFKSKNLGLLEPFTVNNFILSSGRNIFTLVEVSPLVVNHDLTQDMIRCLHIESEIVNKLLPEMESNVQIFDNLIAIIEDQEINPRLKEAYFVANVIKNQGIQPQLDRCVCCEAPLGSAANISLLAGGMVSDNCKHKFPDTKLINKNVVKFWRVLNQIKFTDLGRIVYTKTDLEQLAMILEEYYTENLDINLKSTGVILD